ncbi:hypothetical protein HDV06_006828 [Boothiomyces sp. JEL0866]|nr:hypothetical protein HDV06_006828 [Boothiomyces sp. JEL0866]
MEKSSSRLPDKNLINALELSSRPIQEPKKPEEFTNHHASHFTNSSVILENSNIVQNIQPMFSQEPISPDGQDVLQLLRSGNFTSETEEYSARKTEYPMDNELDKPQVTVHSVIRDGQDIINYLKLNRYAIDMESKDDFDLTSLINEFEQAEKTGDQPRLNKALSRLQMLRRHISKENLK